MKIKLNWQSKAIIIFVAIIFLLSITLTIFAIRAAEREKLVREREIEEEQQRLAEIIIDQVKAIISETEEKIDRMFRNPQILSHEEEFSKVCRRFAEDEEIISEVFLINEKGENIFPLFTPLFFLPEERQNIREKAINIESDILFKKAETSEFRTKNYPLAIESYQKLIDATSDRATSALLLNRIGRCYKKSRKHLLAIDAYQKILKEFSSEVSPDGIPFGIIAQYQIGSIYWNINRKAKGVKAFLELYNSLLKSRWPLSKSQFHFYRNKVRDMIEISTTDINEKSEGRILLKKWDELEKLEEEKLRRMDTKENLIQKVIPLIKTRRPASITAPGGFYHFSESFGKELYLVLYMPIDENSVLGIRIDSEVIASKHLFQILGMLPLRKDWHIQIRNESGNMVAGKDVTPMKDPIPQLTFSRNFTDNFPPWKVNIFQSNPGSAERQFNLRRNIYILSVAVVIAALFFGGFLAIRSTANELKLAKLKSEFVSMVSHELRTPLTSIRYLAELLRRGRVQSEDKKQDYYETITNESEHLSRLIENILDFSKIEAGMKEYQFEEIDIAELAREVATRFQEQVVKKKFELEYEISNQMPKVLADREAVSRALFNLLDNALKYSGESSKVFLRASSDRENIFLEVQDKGMGISREEQKKVFEKFYRSDNVVESNIKGSGLGLTLVAHFVKAHGGEVILESEAGKGTKVTIRIPLKRKMAKNG